MVLDTSECRKEGEACQGNGELILKKFDDQSPTLRSALRPFWAVLASVAGFVPSALAQTFNTFHTFSGPDGAYPYAGLVQAAAAGYVGSTRGGGASNGGVVFVLAADGSATTLCSFAGTDALRRGDGRRRGGHSERYTRHQHQLYGVLTAISSSGRNAVRGLRAPQVVTMPAKSKSCRLRVHQ
jgi:uncharacterized repeat protein (TIGR03803 family)